MHEERTDGERVGRGRRAVLAGASAAVAASVAGCFADESEDAPTDGGENTVVVGPDGEYAFAPDSLSVAVGDTVTWTWDSTNHNVVVDDRPEDAAWSGTDGGVAESYDTGYEYEHAFETPGTYEYYCSPHEGLGMRAEVVVEPEA